MQDFEGKNIFSINLYTRIPMLIAENTLSQVEVDGLGWVARVSEDKAKQVTKQSRSEVFATVRDFF